MQRFRVIILFIALGGAALGGIYLLNLINSDNAIENSSASVFNIAALNPIEDIVYSNSVVIELNLQILAIQKVNSGTFELKYNPDYLSVEDIIMDSNVIALNQKIDSSTGIIILQVESKNSEGFNGILNIAKLIFNKNDTANGFTSISVLSSSDLGVPDTLDPQDKSITIAL